MKISTGGLLLLVVVLVSNVKEGLSAACSGGIDTTTSEYIKYCKNVQSSDANCKVIHPADRYECEADKVCTNSIEKIVKQLLAGDYNGVCKTAGSKICVDVTSIADGAAKPVTKICPASTTAINVQPKSGTNCKLLPANLTYSTDTTNHGTKCAKLDKYTLCKNDGTECIKRSEATLLCDTSVGTSVPADYAICDKVAEPTSTIASNCENIFYKGYTLACTEQDGSKCTDYADSTMLKSGTEVLSSHEGKTFYCKEHKHSKDANKCKALGETVQFKCDNICTNKGLVIDTTSEYKYACKKEVINKKDCKSINIADEFRCSGGACASVVEKVLAKIFPTYSQVCIKDVPNKCASVTSVSADVKQICVAKVDSTTFNKNLFTDCRNLKGELKFDSTNTGSNCVDLSSYNYFNCDGTSKVCDKTKTYLCDDASASLDSHLCKLSPKCEALTSITYSHLCDKPTTATECQELPAIKLLYSNKGKIISPVSGKTFYCSANQANYTCTALATTDEQPTYKCDTSFSECKALSNSSATNTYYGCPNATYTTACFDVDNSKVYFGQSGKVTIPGTVKKLCNVGTAAGCLTTPTYIIDRSCTKQATSTAATKTKTTKPGAGNQLTASWIFTTASILFATKLM